MDKQNLASFQKIKKICQKTRKEMVEKYGKNLTGRCIEAAKKIRDELLNEDIAAYTVEGWCEFEQDIGFTNTPFDPHTWTEVLLGSDFYYIDVTVDQFSYAMIEKIPPIIIGEMPDYMSYVKPYFEEDEEDLY